MDNLDSIMRQLKGMDKTKRAQLLDTLEKSMSASQQNQLKKLLSDKSGRQQLENSLAGIDAQQLLSSITNKEELARALSRDDIQKKLRDILG